MTKRVFSDEDALWNHIQPHLRGWWRRLEAITPDGLADALGLFDGQTQWCELKVGKPSIKALRPAQRDFGYECMRYGIPIWTCFGYDGKARFFLNFDFRIERVPPFWRPPL